MLSVKNPVKREDLADIPFNHADGSDRYKPVEHSVLANSVINQINGLGLDIKKEVWGVAQGNLSLFGEVVLDNVLDNPEMEFTIGIRANNNKRFPVTLVSGANVFICDNLVITGEIIVKKKHTINLHLDDEIRNGISRCVSNSKFMTDMVEQMKVNTVSEPRANDLMMKSAVDGLVSFSHLKDVHKEWKTPSHSEFNPRNEWSLYNCFNEVMKKYNPIRQQKCVGGLVQLISNN